VDEDLKLEITDDGVGLPESRHAGVGLSSMRERAAELGGSCVAEQGPKGGTRVLARLPLRASGGQDPKDGS
jgi:signal transduction histidine kinase